MRAAIAVLPGDGIGPEVTAAAVRVLQTVGHVFGHDWRLTSRPIGAAAIRLGWPALPDETISAALSSDAVLLGAVGDPEFDDHPNGVRPEQALLSLRRRLGLFANVRPVRVWPALRDGGGPLRPEVVNGTDLIIVRELTGGVYYGEPRGYDAEAGSAVNTLRYSRAEIERVARVAFDIARGRHRRVVSVDKANVLEVSRLWRNVVDRLAREAGDVHVTHEYVDAAAMKLIRQPSSFDVILTENLFGDILSDEAAALAGSIGLLPSASLGAGPGLFEPVHGSAPTLAGRNIANPIGAIASTAMLLRDGLGLKEESRAVLDGIERALSAGWRTADIASNSRAPVGTREFTDAVVEAILR